MRTNTEILIEGKIDLQNDLYYQECAEWSGHMLHGLLGTVHRAEKLRMEEMKTVLEQRQASPKAQH